MPLFKTHANFARDFHKCRDETKGRPIRKWCRLFRDGDGYMVKLVMWGRDPEPLFVVDAASTLTFVMPPEKMLQSSVPLTSSLSGVVPLTMERKRQGIYVVAGMKDPQYMSQYKIPLPSGNTEYLDWTKVRKEAPEYFQGIQFNLITGECLNPQPPMMDTIIGDKRKQWLREVKRFKRGLKIRIKVGALDALAISVMADRVAASNTWEYNRKLPLWSSPEITQQVLESMKNDKYPHELLRLIVQTARLGWRQSAITREILTANVDAVFDAQSLHWRKTFGVFGVPRHVKR